MIFPGWRYKKFHPSYGIGWMCAGLLVGVYVSQWVMVAFPVMIIVMAVLCSAMCFMRLRWYACIVVCLCAVVIGLSRGVEYSNDLAPLVAMSGRNIVVLGMVADDPQLSNRGDTRLVVTNIHINNESHSGSIWVSVQGEKKVSRGDSVTIVGKAQPGFGVYQLMMTYAKITSVSPSHDPIIAMRDAFSRAVRSVVVEPSASLGIGFVVGQKSSLPTTLEDQLRIVGLTHMVVASGYNLTILVRFAKRLFEKRSKYLVAVTSAVLVLGFIALSGASPSMVRAGLVAGLSILAWYYGRRFHPLLLIVYVAALTTMMHPLYVWADVGWWLSFLAFFGVLIVSPLALRLVHKNRSTQPSSVVQIVVETMAAQLMTLPIILMTFGMLPMLALVANIITAPLVPFAMLVTFMAGITAMILPSIGVLFGVAADIILSYFVAIIRWLSLPSWAQISFALSPAVMTILYVAILVIATLAWRKTKFNFRSHSSIE